MRILRSSRGAACAGVCAQSRFCAQQSVHTASEPLVQCWRELGLWPSLQNSEACTPELGGVKVHGAVGSVRHTVGDNALDVGHDLHVPRQRKREKGWAGRGGLEQGAGAQRGHEARVEA